MSDNFLGQIFSADSFNRERPLLLNARSDQNMKKNGFKKFDYGSSIKKRVYRNNELSSIKYFSFSASPTYSWHSHEKWGSRHCSSLTGIHEDHPPKVCGTLAFKNGNAETISHFFSQYAKKMRNSFAKEKTLCIKLNKGLTPRSAFFGVFEIRKYDNLIHMHWMARNFFIQPLLDHILVFNSQNNAEFELKYYDNIVDLPAYCAYLFKFGREGKLIFRKGVLRKYVFHCGDYFLGDKNKCMKRGRIKYFSNRNQLA